MDPDYSYSSDSSTSDSDADFLDDDLKSEVQDRRRGLRRPAREPEEYDFELELRKKLLSGLEYVVHQCSAPGRLLHFSLDLETDSSLDRSGVLDDATLDWRGLALSKQSLRSLHYSWRYPASIDGLVSYKSLITCLGFMSLILTSHLRLPSRGILSSPFRTCRWRWNYQSVPRASTTGPPYFFP